MKKLSTVTFRPVPLRPKAFWTVVFGALFFAAMALMAASQAMAAPQGAPRIPLPPADKTVQAPSYVYDCDFEGFCEGLPVQEEADSRAKTPGELAPRMAQASDIRGEGALSGGEAFSRPAAIPLALAESFAIQSKLRDVETYLGGFRTQVGIIAADPKVAISSRQRK